MLSGVPERVANELTVDRASRVADRGPRIATLFPRLDLNSDGIGSDRIGSGIRSIRFKHGSRVTDRQV